MLLLIVISISCEKRLPDGCIEDPLYVLGTLWGIGSTFSWLLGLGMVLSTEHRIRRVLSMSGGIGLIIFGLWGTAHAFGLLFFDVHPCIPFLSLHGLHGVIV
jgi:hypothetical protein